MHSFNILNFWCYKKIPIGSGLTIPFLIGVDFNINGYVPLSTFNKLSELNNNPKGAFFSILFCPNINQYIVQLNDKTDLPSLSYYKKFNYLFIACTLLSKLNTLEEISEFLDDKYMLHIKKYHFSLEDNNWRPFNDFEKKLISNYCRVNT